MNRIGFHVSAAGGVSNAFDNAREIGCNAMQIFLSSPQMWDVSPISKEEKARFIEKDKSSDIKPSLSTCRISQTFLRQKPTPTRSR